MIFTKVYAYVPEAENAYIGTAYSPNSLYELVYKYWNESEHNEKIPLLLQRVNKREKDNEDDDGDFKDWEADQQYKWFVEGNNKDLFED